MQTEVKQSNTRLFDEEVKRPSSTTLIDPALRAIPFYPDWLDDEGLPTRLGRWIIDNLPYGETFAGVRATNDELFPFQITRGAKSPHGQEVSRAYVAKFDMSMHRVMEVVPGCITISDTRSNQQLKKFLEYGPAIGGSYWKLYSEVRKIVTETYDECPNVLYYALQQIDVMAYQIAPEENSSSRVSTLLGMLLPGSPYQDRYATKVTPMNIRMVYYMLRDKMRQQKSETPPANSPVAQRRYTVALERNNDQSITPDMIRLIYLERIEGRSDWEVFRDTLRRVALGQLHYPVWEQEAI